MKFTRMFIYLIIVFVLFPANSVWAVRPFITDDARVTPAHTFLTETSLRMDSNRYQNLTLFALGVTSKLEATVGFTDGVLVKDDGGQTWQMSAAGPLVQMKYLFKEQKGVDGFPAVGTRAWNESSIKRPLANTNVRRQ